MLTVAPVSGYVGTLLTFNGTGYAHSSAITVSWSYGTACTATTNSKGNFSCTYQIPATYNGGWTFTGTDASSNTASATFTVIQQLTVSPTSGPAGTTVTFVGTGYDSPDTTGGAQVWITWMSGSVQACDVATNGQGSMSCTYVIPETPAGQYTFTGADNTPHTATAAFSVIPTLTASPASGLVGTLVTFNGTSYATSSSVTVTWTHGTACTATTSTAGAFSCSFTIPAYTVGGTYTFTGTDASSHKATAAFVDTPKLSISRSPNTVTKTVTFSGKGFNDSAPVTVTWSGGTACTATTSSTGGFSCTFKIPATPAGSYTFNATDENDNTAKVVLKVIPALTGTPTSGTVGSLVIFSGTGFAGSSKVNVTWVSGTACSAKSTKVGSFSCEFTIPQTANGMYTFTGTDAKGNAAATTYTVEADLTDSPVSGPVGTTVTFNGTGFAGASAVTVSWSGGTACLTITNVSGNFSCTFTIPAGTSSGTYTFTATDAQSNVAKASFDVT